MIATLTPAPVSYARTPGQVQATIKRAKAKRERRALRNIRNEKRATRGALAYRGDVVTSKRAPRPRKAPASK